MTGKPLARKEQEEREYMTKEEILRELFREYRGKSDDELRAVRKELVKKYHPDNVHDDGGMDAARIRALNEPDWLEIVKREINIFKISNCGKTIEGYREGGYHGESLEIPEGTEAISDGAFWAKEGEYDWAPKKIIFPKTLRYIGENAFRRCVVREIVFKHGDEDEITIYPGAFSNCAGLSNIEFPKKTTFVYPGSKGYLILDRITVRQLDLWPTMKNIRAVISHNRKPGEWTGTMEKVVLNGFTEIQQHPFASSCVKEVSGSLLEVIGESAFRESLLLETINFPSIKQIKNNAFYSCQYLKQLDLYSVENIEWDAFSDCTGLKEVRLAGNLKQIGSRAFSGCKALAKIDSLRSVTEVKDNAFSGCESLEEIILPQVKRIGAGAFKGCLKLKRVEMPSVEVIEDGAFEGCAALAKVRIPDSVQKIGSRIFASCTSLMVVSVSRENQGLFSRDAFEGCEKTAGELLVNPQLRPVRQSFCKSLVCENGLHLQSIPVTLDNDMVIGGITVSAASAQVMVTLHSYDRNEIKIQCLSLGHEPVEIEARAELLLYGQGQIVVMKEAEQ